MKIRFIPVIAVLICFGMYLVSCSSRRVKKDMTGINDLAPKIADGRLVFKNNCQKCHPNGEAGVGPALNDKRIPSIIVRARIRSRATFLWTGRMPSFNKHEISGTELNALMAYLKSMKKKDK